MPAPLYAFFGDGESGSGYMHIYWYLSVCVCGGGGRGRGVDKCGWSHWASRTCTSGKASFSLFSSAIVMVRMYVAVF